MKEEQEVGTCDQCGKQSKFIKGNIGNSYFPGWVNVKQNHSSGFGCYSTDQPLTDEKHFCCLKCAVVYLVNLLYKQVEEGEVLKEEDDKADIEKEKRKRRKTAEEGDILKY